MSNLTSQATVDLLINGQQAQQTLAQLRQNALQLETAIAKAAASGNKTDLKRLRKELTDTKRQIREIESATQQVEHVMRNLDKATPRELNQTLSTLNKQLNYMQRGSAQWNAQVEKIRLVKAELATVNNQLKQQQSIWERMEATVNKWQMTIMAGAAAVTGLVMAGRKAVSAFAELDTELANTRKFTGIAGDDLGKLSHLDKSKLFFLIWTTTTWTLPGNLGITLSPGDSYAIVKVPNGEMYIMAEALIPVVMKAGGVESWEIVETHEGRFFEYMLADHPFLPKTSLLMLADYVTMDSGTGCVHTAPGFGADDYQTCMRYHTDMVVPVDDQGRHTDYAGKYAGLTTEESNPVILADMKESGVLFASENMVHSYPHCWRCKKPIIFRATPQWFCSVDSFKDEAIQACEDVRWLPAWGKERMGAMIRERADWCISRQRRWGLPIPVVYCDDCGKPVCTDESIETIAAIFEKEGSNAWFDREAAELLPQGFTCPHCGGKHFTKETDTLDGWFDSGSTHYAAMKRDQGFWPADMYMEGGDQYRGWFQSSLLVAVGALGEGAPYKECLTHGWTVDGEGKAMHKSLGNGIDPADLFKEFGADLVRLWAGSMDYHVDVRCSKEIFKQLSQNYLKFRNTARYCLGNLDGFDANDLVKPEEMLPLDRWAITKLNELIDSCMAAYNDYEFHVVSHLINDFCVVELSSFYLDIIKDRLYCEERNGLKRRSAQTALYLILDSMTRLFAPILAFTCDEIWLAMPHREGDDTRNVVFNEMNKPFTDYALPADEMARWEQMIKLRDDVNAVLEQARADKRIGKPLEAAVSLHPTDADSRALVERLSDMDLDEMFIVSHCLISEEDLPAEAAATGKSALAPGLSISVTEAPGTKCPRCWKHSTQADPETGLCPRCAAVVAKL